MNMRDLQPAKNFAIKFGAKFLVHGAPGSGKTPICNTAPRPVLGFSEPGLLSMRNSNIPSIPLFTPKALDDFFGWVTGSNEMKNFDMLCFDSVSQAAEIYLEEAKQKYRDGRQAYGAMSERLFPHLSKIYFQQNLHTYLICKQMVQDGSQVLVPYFPGKDLNIRVAHMFDIILHCGTFAVPGVGQQKAFRAFGGFEALCRDRSGSLAEFEPTNLTALVNKVIQ